MFSNNCKWKLTFKIKMNEICLFWSFYINDILFYVMFCFAFFHLAYCIQGTFMFSHVPGIL